jgi:hypothetical protein
MAHTPHLRASIISSMSFTAISTLFNLYATRRGTMVVVRTAHQTKRTLYRSVVVHHPISRGGYVPTSYSMIRAAPCPVLNI